MNKEIQSINQLSTEQLIQQRGKTLQTIEKRGYHIGQIGHCKIEYGSSFENSLELGLRLSDAKERLEQDQNYLNGLNQELDAYNQAKQYLDTKKLRETQLAQMSLMVTQGNVPQEIFQQHQNEYQELVSLSETDPILIRGIARIQQEAERKEESQETKPTDDNKLRGKSAQLLALLEDSSSDILITSDQLTEGLWPGINNDTARKRLSVLISRIKSQLQGTNLDLVVISDPSKKIKGEKAKYYLTRIERPNPVSEPTQPDKISQTSEDEELTSINKPEYGTLSRADITIIAAAIINNESILEPILKASGVRLIEEQTISELLDITGEICLADFKKMTPEQYRDSLGKFRTEALQKAKDLIESPEANKILEAIHTKNPEVWCLLVNLSEMNDKLKGQSKNGKNYYDIKQGITFLMDLVTDSKETKWTYYVTDDQGKESRRCIYYGVGVMDIICSGKD